MILVDTNILIGYVRKPDPKVLGILQSQQAAACGIVRAELLQGAKNAADRQLMLKQLQICGHITIPDDLWDDIGDNLAALRAHGIIVPFNDVVLATVAIANDIELWTRDKQFLHIQRVLGALRLFVEPP